MDAPTRHTETVIAGQTGYAVPLVVSVTGHRDLVDDEVPAIRKRVHTFLRRLKLEYPARGVTVMSSLAEGADQLVAEEALALGLKLVAALPMARDLYIEDFETPRARERFDALLSQASEVFELPVTPGNTAASIATPGKNRTRQYAQLGVFLCAHCHILLALWDGKYNDKLGGTGQVVRFHHDAVMPGYTARSVNTRLILAEDESDLVYHIVCSRNRPAGGPAEGLKALTCEWYTTDVTRPRTQRMPLRYRKILDRTSEFSHDAQIHVDRIQSEAWPLIDEQAMPHLPPSLRDIDHVFRSADWLAIYFQKRHLLALRSTHAMAMLMGIAYIAYSDLFPTRLFIFAFVAFFVIATAIHRYSFRQAWHRKYLDYRTLAEGLRVQFYWAAAGVSSGIVSKFLHDNFLQMQDSDLGWIRNVMRVAGMESDVAPHREPYGVEFAVQQWIGDARSGQLGYYARKIREKSGRNNRTEQFAKTIAWVTAVALALFVFADADFADSIRDPVVVLMGVLLLAVGVRQSYAFSVADFELVKQYKFMARTFTKAKRRIDTCETDDERRGVLRVLGEAALDEHAEWILMHRDRAVDEGELLRMTG